MNDTTKDLANKLFAACAHLKIKKIKVDFDGEGDSGQIEEITFYNEKSEEVHPVVDLGECVVVVGHRLVDSGWEDVTKTTKLTLKEAAEQIAYDTLERKHSGWEINEGSYGTIYFDIDERKVRCEFNERIVEANYSGDYSEEEFDLDDTTEES